MEGLAFGALLIFALVVVLKEPYPDNNIDCDDKSKKYFNNVKEHHKNGKD